MISLEQWIAGVRSKPEHVRIRYVFGCVIASMVLVVGVWMLSLTESFKTAAQDSSTSNFNQILPKPSDFSLEALTGAQQSLGTEMRAVSGEEYFKNQYEAKKNATPEEAVVQPKKEGE